MDIVAAYEQVGTYRGAADLCGTTHKTVKRVIERRGAGEPFEATRRPARPKNTDCVGGVIADKVRATDGRISAKRLLPAARAAGYVGSSRNFRRAVAEAKAAWRRKRRIYRPWQPSPGEHLVIDWTTEGSWQVFCAVSAWSRYRFVRLARDQRAATTLRLLAECFEELGGVPAVVLADRMGCLKGGVVANVVVPTPDYVRFATHFGFRPELQGNFDMVSKTELLDEVRRRGGRVSARQLTSWVTEGLLPRSARIGSKHGAYPTVVVDVVNWIDESRRRGLSVEAIKELLPIWRFVRKGFARRRLDFQEFEYLARQFVRSPEAIHAVPLLLLDCLPCPICKGDVLAETAFVMKGGEEFDKANQTFVPLAFVIARQDSDGKGRVVSQAGLALPLVRPDQQNAIVLGIPNGVPLESEHDDQAVSIELGSEPRGESHS